jgi:hypothetical protein
LPHARHLLPVVLLLVGTVSPVLGGKPDERPALMKLETISYPVADLVAPVLGSADTIEIVLMNTTGRNGKRLTSAKTIEDALMKLIVRMVCLNAAEPQTET